MMEKESTCKSFPFDFSKKELKKVLKAKKVIKVSDVDDFHDDHEPCVEATIELDTINLGHIEILWVNYEVVSDVYRCAEGMKYFNKFVLNALKALAKQENEDNEEDEENAE